MMELPEAVVIAGQVQDTLVGRRIERATAGASPHKFAWYTGDPATYNNRLAGKTIRSAAAVAGNVEIDAGDYYMVISAAMRYHAPGQKGPAKHQLLLEFDDGSALSASIQMWGALMCPRAGEQVEFEGYSYAKTLPSPISDGFTRQYFDSLFTPDSGKLSTKAFLATHQRIPGLGNGVLQDILWTARLHPKRKMDTLSDDEVQGMYAAVTSVMRAMTEKGGRDTELDLFGEPGKYITVLSKFTVDTPCPVCHQVIRKEPYLGGSIYYCPGCQKM